MPLEAVLILDVVEAIPDIFKTINQEFGLWNYVVRWGRGLVRFLSVVHYEDLPDRTSVPAGSYIVSAPGQSSSGGTRLVSELVAQLRASPAARGIQ